MILHRNRLTAGGSIGLVQSRWLLTDLHRSTINLSGLTQTTLPFVFREIKCMKIHFLKVIWIAGQSLSQSIKWVSHTCYIISPRTKVSTKRIRKEVTSSKPNLLPTICPSLSVPVTHPLGLKLICDRQKYNIFWIDPQIFTKSDRSVYCYLFSSVLYNTWPSML